MVLPIAFVNSPWMVSNLELCYLHDAQALQYLFPDASDNMAREIGGKSRSIHNGNHCS
jgi:hypothetical protein